MADDVVIKVSVDDDELLQASNRVDELTQDLTDLEGQQKRLKDSNKELSKSQKDLNEAYLDGTVTTDEYEQKSKDLDSQLTKNNKTLAINQQTIQKNRRERTNAIKLMQSEQGTRARLRQEAAKLNREYNELNQTTVEGRVKAEQLQMRLSDINEELREGSKAAGNFQDNIGNYPELLGSAGQGAFDFAGGIKGMVSEAWNFIKTPLGATITALVAVVGAFKAGLSGSQRAMSGIAIASGRVGGAADYMKSKLGEFSEFVTDQLNKGLSNFVRFLEEIGLKEQNDELDEYMKRGALIAVMNQKLVLVEAKLNKTRAETELQVERLMHQRDLESNSIEKRIRANQQIQGLLIKQEKEELALMDEKINLQNMIIEQEGINFQNGAELLNLQAERTTIESDYAGKISEVIANINSLNNEQKAAEEARIKARQIEIDQINQEIEAVDSLDNEWMEFNEALEETGEVMGEIVIPQTEKAKLTFMDFVDSAKMGLSLISDAFAVNTENNINKLEAQKEASLRLAGEDAEARERIENQFARKEYQLKKRQFLIDKAETIAQIGIQTALNVAKAALNPVLAVAAGVLGAAQIAIVAAKKYPPQTFAKGGTIVQGGSHSSGNDVGVYGDNGQFFGRVEGGEAMFVMKKNATEALKMSQYNQEFGGRSFFSKPERINQEGGQLAPQNQTLSPEQLQSIISNMQVVVSVKDIITGIEKRVEVLENAAV